MDRKKNMPDREEKKAVWGGQWDRYCCGKRGFWTLALVFALIWAEIIPLMFNLFYLMNLEHKLQKSYWSFTGQLNHPIRQRAVCYFGTGANKTYKPCKCQKLLSHISVGIPWNFVLGVNSLLQSWLPVCPCASELFYLCFSLKLFCLQYVVTSSLGRDSLFFYRSVYNGSWSLLGFYMQFNRNNKYKTKVY